jgi:hypothetical protein
MSSSGKMYVNNLEKYNPVKRRRILKKFCSQQTGEEALEKGARQCDCKKKQRENIPVSACAKANDGDRVALNAHLGSDGLDDKANEASDDVVGSGGSRFVEGLAALDGAAVAAASDSGGSNCGGSQGSSDEEGDFGEHFWKGGIKVNGVCSTGK